LEETEEIPLQAGSGVNFSKDGLHLTAIIQGLPSMDAKGVISVLEQFTVKGDVDFKTGNINFNGNVLITGMVKEGFKVVCDDLTANEITGATILIRGDLKVSKGIVNSYIETQGNVQAKFLNNTKIFAHGNMMITREIMGSRILISGALSNEAGRITDSHIAARMGFSIKQVGTEMADPSTIRMGVDDHISWITERFDNGINILQKELDDAVRQKDFHDQNYNDLHVDVANQTFVQEKLNQKKIFLGKTIGVAKSKEEKLNIALELNEIETSIEQADERIKAIFLEQDAIVKEMETCDKTIEGLNIRIENLQMEKQGEIQHLKKESPAPILKVNKKLFKGTKIMGTSASMVLKDDLGKSKLMEIDSDSPDSPKQIVHQTL
jgi:uncharacterized protein (DUF342 family)